MYLLPAPSNLRRLIQHDLHRAQLFHRTVDGPFCLVVRNVSVEDIVDVDGGERGGDRVRVALARHGDLDILQLLALLAQEMDNIDSAATAEGGEQHLHGPQAFVVAADIGGAIGFNGQAVFVAGLKVEVLV